MTKKTGGSNEYYKVDVIHTLDGRPGHTVQCLEVIEALGMTFVEGEAFKAIWRSCASRTLGKHKPDNNSLYDAEKVEFYGKRMIVANTPSDESTCNGNENPPTTSPAILATESPDSGLAKG